MMSNLRLCVDAICKDSCTTMLLRATFSERMFILRSRWFRFCCSGIGVRNICVVGGVNFHLSVLRGRSRRCGVGRCFGSSGRARQGVGRCEWLSEPDCIGVGAGFRFVKPHIPQISDSGESVFVSGLVLWCTPLCRLVFGGCVSFLGGRLVGSVGFLASVGAGAALRGVITSAVYAQFADIKWVVSGCVSGVRAGCA